MFDVYENLYSPEIHPVADNMRNNLTNLTNRIQIMSTILDSIIILHRIAFLL